MGGGREKEEAPKERLRETEREREGGGSFKRWRGWRKRERRESKERGSKSSESAEESWRSTPSFNCHASDHPKPN